MATVLLRHEELLGLLASQCLTALGLLPTRGLRSSICPCQLLSMELHRQVLPDIVCPVRRSGLRHEPA